MSTMELAPNPSPAGRFLFRLAGAAIIAAAAFGVTTLRTRKHAAEAHEGAARESAVREGPLVQAARVVPAPPTRAITLSGDVQPFRRTTLYAKVSGYLKHIGVDKGDRVKGGQVLGIIESPETEHDIASKQADVAVKKLTEERFRNLSHEGLVSSQDLEKAAADLKIATSDLARLNVLRDYQVIRAPFDGVVTARHADPGALLQAATASQSALPLVDVADLDVVRVYVYLGQNEALAVHEGDAVAIWTDQRPNDKVQAKITRFSKQLDPKTRTMLTEIDVDNKAGTFYPGIFVRVSLTVAAPPALSVPADAVFVRGGKSTAAVIKDGHAEFVPVEIGEHDGKTVRVTSGLAEGDVVGLHVGDEVEPGAAVRAVIAAPSAKPAAPAASGKAPGK